jgi:hypothetical protein
MVEGAPGTGPASRGMGAVSRPPGGLDRSRATRHKSFGLARIVRRAAFANNAGQTLSRRIGETSMPELRWDKLEFLECLEVIPDEEEYGVSFSYKVDREPLTLLMTVWPFESVVQVSVYLRQPSAPVIEFTGFVRGGVRRVDDKRGDYLEFTDTVVAPSRFWYLEAGNVFDQARHPYGVTVEVGVRPHIFVRLAQV